MYFLTVQEHYGHRPVTELSTWLKVEFVNSPGEFAPSWGEWVNEGLATVLVPGAVLLVPAVRRRLGWGEATYVVGVLLITWVGPNWLAPGGRYLLPAVPLLAVPVAEWLAPRRRLCRLVVIVSGATMLVLAGLFSGRIDLWFEW